MTINHSKRKERQQVKLHTSLCISSAHKNSSLCESKSSPYLLILSSSTLYQPFPSNHQKHFTHPDKVPLNPTNKLISCPCNICSNTFNLYDIRQSSPCSHSDNKINDSTSTIFWHLLPLPSIFQKPFTSPNPVLMQASDAELGVIASPMIYTLWENLIQTRRDRNCFWRSTVNLFENFNIWKRE